MSVTRSVRVHPAAPLRYLLSATAARTSLEMIPTGAILQFAARGQDVRTPALMLAVFMGVAAVAGPAVAGVFGAIRRPVVTYRYATGLLAAAEVGLSGTAGRSTTVLIVAAAMAGLCQQVLSSGWSSCLGRLANPADMASASAADVATYCAASAMGPLAAGGAAQLDPRLPLLAAAALSLVAIPVTIRMQMPGGPGGADVRHPYSAMVSCIPALFRSRRFVVLQTLQMLPQPVAVAVVLSAPVLSTHLVGSVAFAGPMVSMLAVGAFVVSIGLTSLRRASIPAAAIGLIYAAGAASLLLVPTAWLAVVALLVMSAANGWSLTELFHVTSRDIAPRSRAQGFAVGAALRSMCSAAGTFVLGSRWFPSPDARIQSAVIPLVTLSLGLIAVTVYGHWRRRSPPGETTVATDSNDG